MATEPSFDDNTAAHPPEQGVDELRQRLRRYLDRHLVSDRIRAPLTILGFDDSNIEVLQHAIDQPQDALLGFELRPSYWALGVVAPSVVATPPNRRHHEAALALAVSRSGTTISMLVDPAGVIETRAPSGWLIDACRRSVGLSTAACDIAALDFPVAVWLDRVMVALLHAPRPDPISWPEVVELCPVPHRWRSLDPVDLGTTLGSTTTSWSALRQATAHGGRSPADVHPGDAAWMDDAMFARWCMGSYPEVSTLRADLEFLAPESVLERIEVALRAAWLAFAE